MTGKIMASRNANLAMPFVWFSGTALDDWQITLSPPEQAAKDFGVPHPSL
jgi:hypothetical protein